MKDRFFAPENRPVSEVGIGCWQFSSEWGDLSDNEAVKILHTAYENGVTFFDTADVYGMGRSEKLIGSFLAEKKQSVFVATKIGRRPDIYPNGFTPKKIEEHIDGCLQRLKRETLDLVQLHCIPPAEMQKGEVFEILRRIKQRGKIQRFGASVESVDEALLCLEQDGLASLQVIFNLFRQKLIDELFEKSAAQGVSLIARVPLASGVLSGKFSQKTVFSSGDHRSFNKDGEKFNVGETFAGVPFEKGISLVEKLSALCPPGYSMAQMALRWILDFPAVTVVIPGATSTDQVLSNVSASDLPPLSDELHRQLRLIYQTDIHHCVRGKY